MKLLFFIIVALFISGGVYLFTSARIKSKVKKSKKFTKKPIIFASVIFIILLAIIAFGIFITANQPDLQCTSSHTTTTQPPSSLISSNDYFLNGNYDYDIGNCPKAILDYTKAIQLDPNSAQLYNNRAYTNMRLRNYKDALSDLDKAIQINPNYVQALMNRGDIHNYYYQINRQAAIADYKKVIALTSSNNRQETSICGHLFLAEHNGWTPQAYIDFFMGNFGTCK